MKIVADENIAYAAHFFAPLGELVLLPGRAIRRVDVQDADILLVRSVTSVNRDLLEGTAVRFVGSCTIGTDHIDSIYLQKNNIRFAYAPGCNAQAVVEYVLSAFLTLEVNFSSSRIGIVGCGNVGGRLLRCLQAVGANVVGCDPFLIDTDISLVNFEKILECEVICVHTPLTKTGLHPTFHLFDAAIINSLKPGAVLLNAGRGAVIDNSALLQRLQTHNDLQVVLDVWENEPAINPDLLKSVAIGTPHIAGYSAEGKLRGTEMVYDVLCDFLGLNKTAAPVSLDGEVAPYAIAADAAALREQYPVDGALAFDRLRKYYVPRRESSVVVNGLLL
ncbi:MAG TPA: 4-phosphoerythronate dehydrogenase [Pseudomonadales bacterium]|nr:4-phosphoerythronate dehydrogenase [Pseudomonadales bacterium]